ncbi:MAG TPA: DUF6458 family protein [Trebonia sp.]|nr:DUF6458 family protein [Trebonia sp.]
MRTGAGLALIAIGAIFAFAVNATWSAVNVHVVGWVLMIVGLAGILINRSTYTWLGRRVVRRRSYARPVRTVEVGEVPVPPNAARSPQAARIEAGLAPYSADRDDLAGDRVVIDPATGRRVVPGGTEVIEDIYEE